jgi:hypothetical protein
MGRPDEAEALRHTDAFSAGDLNPGWFVYPNLFFWVVWLWDEAVLAATRLVTPVASYAELVRTDDLAPLILGGRVLSAIVGTLTVVTTAVVGRRLGGWALGLASAALLAVCFLHVRDSHALKADVYMTAGMIPCLWLLARWVGTPTPALALLAGVAIGVTMGMKYPAVLLMVAAWQASWMVRAGDGLRRVLPHRHMVGVGVVAALVFFAVSPFFFLDAEQLRATVDLVLRATYGARPGQAGEASAPWIEQLSTFLGARTFRYHLAVSLRHGMGLPMALLVPLAIGAAAWREREPFFALGALFCVVYYLAIGYGQATLARYLTPLTPLLCLLVARLLTRACAALPRPDLRVAVLIAATIGLAVPSLRSAVAYDRIAARPDTRVQAYDWMARELPAGAVVAVLGSVYFPIADPALPPQARRAALKLAEKNLDRHGVTHVVTHEHPLPWSSPLPGQLAAQGDRLEPLATFTPFAAGPTGGFEAHDAHFIPFFDFAGVVRPGPIVRIFRLRPAAPPPPALLDVRRRPAPARASRGKLRRHSGLTPMAHAGTR